MKPASDPRIDRTRWLETSQALITLAGTQASLRTLRGANDAFAATLNSNGFNPMKDYELVALRSGYRAELHTAQVIAQPGDFLCCNRVAQ